MVNRRTGLPYGIKIRWWFARLWWAFTAPGDRDWMAADWWEDLA